MALSRDHICLVAFCAVCIFVFNVYIISLNLVDPDAVLAKVEQAGVRSAIILQQKKSRLRNSRQRGTKTDGFQWSDLGGDVEFRVEKSQWVEFKGGKPVWYFSEKSRNADTLVVHIANASRGIHLRLDNEQVQFRFNEKSKWEDLYTGSWTRFEGADPKSVAPNLEPEKEAASLFVPPPPQHNARDTPTAKIVLLLAAYRDPLCGNTLAEAFMHAKYPERIYASVVQQNGDGDLDCMKEFCRIYPECPKERVTIIPKSLSRSRGVMAARYHQLYGIKDEEFCLQTDSHSAFEDDWDMLAINDWLLTNNEMAVLTT